MKLIKYCDHTHILTFLLRYHHYFYMKWHEDGRMMKNFIITIVMMWNARASPAIWNHSIFVENSASTKHQAETFIFWKIWRENFLIIIFQKRQKKIYFTFTFRWKNPWKPFSTYMAILITWYLMIFLEIMKSCELSRALKC